mgnify:CR=1 FL=1
MGALWSFIALVLRLGVALILGVAAINKIPDPQKFAFAVKGFKLLPEHLEILATFVVPWAEAMCAVLLVVGLWTRAAALLSAGLMAGFIFGIASVLERNMSVACGCFGDNFRLFCGPTLSWCNVVQNGVIGGAALLVALFGPGAVSIDRIFAPRRVVKKAG